jgi:hypothetical protein
MITSFDDYCIHQTHEPVAQPSQSDRNFYDRYWFNGFDRDGAFLFEIGFGLYPNGRTFQRGGRRRAAQLPCLAARTA